MKVNQVSKAAKEKKIDIGPVHEIDPDYLEGNSLTADRLAQLVEHQTAVREVAGSNLGRTNTQGL